MNRTPYSCAPYGENNFRAFWDNHWRYYMRRNYIIVLQDVRGRWMSEGEFVDVRPFNPNKKAMSDDRQGIEFDEASDTYDAIDWLVKNIPNNNKKVGIFGISYPGFYSTIAALSNHPSLVAVSPQAPVTDWFMGDDFHHNGAFMLMDAFNFYSAFHSSPQGRLGGALYYQHRISIAEETVLVFDRFFISLHGKIVTCKCTGHDQQTCFWQVEVGYQ